MHFKYIDNALIQLEKKKELNVGNFLNLTLAALLHNGKGRGYQVPTLD